MLSIKDELHNIGAHLLSKSRDNILICVLPGFTLLKDATIINSRCKVPFY